MNSPQNTTAPQTETAYIALGSNLDSSVGSPVQTLRVVTARLQHWTTGEFAASSLYQSKAEGCPDGSPDFINGVVSLELDSALDSHELLLRLQALEAEYGRKRTGQRNAPRTLDLDLIAFGNRRLRNETLELPHPRAHLRRFVLEPLAEISPDLVLPGMHKTVSELMGNDPAGGLCRVIEIP